MQDHAEVVAAAEAVAPRQPIHGDRRFLGDFRPHRREHRLIRAEHAMRRDHALRRSRGTRSEHDFGDRLGADAFCGGIREHRIAREFACGRDHRRRARDALRDPRVAGEHERGIELGEKVAQASGRRIGTRVADGDRRHRNADVLPRERHQRVLDAVLRNDAERRVGGRAALDQPGADSANATQELAVAEAHPRAVGTAFGHEGRVRRARSPGAHVVTRAARVGSELAARADDGGAVRCGFYVERIHVDRIPRKKT